MDHKKKIHIFRWGVELMLIWSVLVGTLGMQTAVSFASQDRSGNSDSIRLVLQMSKRTYRAGQPIPLAVYLENVSKNEQYYVGTDLGNLFSIESFHYIELEITDERGRTVPVGRGAGTSIWKPGETIADKLSTQYIQLGPNMIFGIKNGSDLSLQPGRYQLRAIYHELEAVNWSQDER